MILIRVLSKEQMGVWALFLIITTIFETTKTSLLKNAHIKFVSSDVDNFNKTHIASSSLAMNISISLLFIIFLYFFHKPFSDFFNSGKELSDMLLWFIPGLIFMVFFSHLEAIQQSHFDFKGIFAGHLTRQVIFFILICVEYFNNSAFTMKSLAIFQSVSVLGGAIVLYMYSKKYLHHIFNPTKIWIKKLSNYGGYIFGTGLITNLSVNTDQMLMGIFMNPGAVALYNASSRISGFVDIPSFAASEILFPKLVKANDVEGETKVQYFLERMTSVLLCIVVPAALFIIIFPKFVVGIIAGKEYLNAALILQLYMITSIIGVFQNQAANTLNSIGKPGLCFRLNLVSFVIKVALTYSCLVAFDFYGAAIGTVLTFFLSFFVWYYFLRKIVKVSFSRILGMVINNYNLIFVRAKELVKKRAIKSPG